VLGADRLVTHLAEVTRARALMAFLESKV